MYTYQQTPKHWLVDMYCHIKPYYSNPKTNSS